MSGHTVKNVQFEYNNTHNVALESQRNRGAVNVVIKQRVRTGESTARFTTNQARRMARSGQTENKGHALERLAEFQDKQDDNRKERIAIHP